MSVSVHSAEHIAAMIEVGCGCVCHLSVCSFAVPVVVIFAQLFDVFPNVVLIMIHHFYGLLVTIFLLILFPPLIKPLVRLSHRLGHSSQVVHRQQYVQDVFLLLAGDFLNFVFLGVEGSELFLVCTVISILDGLFNLEVLLHPLFETFVAKVIKWVVQVGHLNLTLAFMLVLRGGVDLLFALQSMFLLGILESLLPLLFQSFADLGKLTLFHVSVDFQFLIDVGEALIVDCVLRDASI